MKRIGMYAATGREMQLLARQLLMDLCFPDDRGADFDRGWSRLLASYGKRSVTPKAVKKARRALHPVDNAVYSMQRSAATAIRSGRKKSKGPVFRHANLNRSGGLRFGY
jgi:hypothetical protein